MFESGRLKEIIAELGAELKPLGRDPRLKDSDQTRTLVDCTLVSVLPKLMQISWLKRTTQFAVNTAEGDRNILWVFQAHPGPLALAEP